MSQQGKHLYEFGPFLLDEAEGVLRREGVPVRLTPKGFLLLLVLVRNSGRTVSKDSLMSEVWPDSIVEENNLTVNISAVRQVLGEDRLNPKYIETVPKRGYRFVAPVREVQGQDGGQIERAVTPLSTRKADKEEVWAGGVNWVGVPPSVLGDGQSAARGGQQAGAYTSPQRVIAVAQTSERQIRWNKAHRGAILIVVLVIIAVVGAFTWYRFVDRSGAVADSGPAFQEMKVERVTSGSNITTAAISPDGRYLAYSIQDGGRQSLRVKQVGAATDLQIIPPAPILFIGETFSPDGSHIYYVVQGEDRSTGVYRVPVLGGASQKIYERIGSPVTLSTDGRRLAFLRTDKGREETSLWVINADGSGEQKLATRTGSEWFVGGPAIGPAWSPDGGAIACLVRSVDPRGEYYTVVEVRLEGGAQRPLTSHRWGYPGQVAWLPNGTGLVVVANGQLWHLSHPAGKVRKVTNDANWYSGVSLAALAGSMVTVQSEVRSSVWVIRNGDTEGAKPVTSGRQEGYHGLRWAADGTLIYSLNNSADVGLWRVDADGEGRRPLAADAELTNTSPSVTPDGRYIVFTSSRGGAPHIWRANIDGSNPKQLTDGPGEGWPACSPDGRWVVYNSFAAAGPQSIWKVPIEGGEPVQVTQMISSLPAFSPDGKLLAVRCQGGAGEQVKLCVLSFEDGRLVKEFGLQPTTVISGDYKALRWTPDGGSLAYIDTRTGVPNVWARPLDGSPEKQLTDFKTDQVFGFDWSRDGKYLAVARGTITKDVILFSDLK